MTACADNKPSNARSTLRSIRHPLLAAFTGFLTIICTSAAAQAQLDKPRVPAGIDPGGVTVAVIGNGNGIDYTRPEIAARLARDGEGELIGWDFLDDTRRPFEKCGARTQHAGHCNETPLDFLASSRVRVIPLRATLEKNQSLVEAVRFATRAGARIVLVALPQPPPARFLEEAAAWHTAPLFIAGVVPDKRSPPFELAMGANYVIADATTQPPETSRAKIAELLSAAVTCAATGIPDATALRDCAIATPPKRP